jgi:hypothetical protein
MNSTSPTRKTPSKPVRAVFSESPQQSHTDELICQLKSIGKLAVSLKEAQGLLPYSARTFRRFELRGMLNRMKGTSRVVYAVSDLIKLVREMR